MKGSPALRALWHAGLALAVSATLAACGGGGDTAIPTPPPPPAATFTIGVTVTTALGAGESFRFALTAGTQAASVTQSGVSVKFANALASGTAYTVNQTDGPRTCTLSANRTGTLAANVEVGADCGTPPGSSALTGNFWGPIGSTVSLQNLGAGDLDVSVPVFVGGPAAYNQQPFSFAAPALDGSAYQVTLKTQPAGQTCRVHTGGTGTMPVATGTVKVGCEHTLDHLSRNTDSSVRGTYFDSSAVAIGGATDAVGATSQGYGEGRFVAFVSSAAGIDGSTGAHRQIFWRDRFTGETKLISASPAGAQGDGDSFAPAISADGLHVVFESYATNLVASDTNGVRDIFIFAADNGTLPASLERVSVGAAGVQSNAESYGATVSGDGKVVAFSSGASNLTGGVSGINTINVIRRDRSSATNTLISADRSNGSGVGGDRAQLSEDGNRLAFYSFSAQITAADTNSLWDIFVYDHAAGNTVRVSVTASGGERDQGSESASRLVSPAISGDGRYVAFATTANNMVAGDTNGLQDVFVVDTSTGAVQRASVGAAGAQGNGDSPVGQGERVALSRDGTWLAHSTGASNLGAPAGNMLLRNLKTGEVRAVSNITGGSVSAPSLSGNALYLAFGASSALDLRFTSTGLFAYFSGLGKAYFWQ